MRILIKIVAEFCTYLAYCNIFVFCFCMLCPFRLHFSLQRHVTVLYPHFICSTRQQSILYVPAPFIYLSLIHI